MHFHGKKSPRLSLPRRRESRRPYKDWIPASAGMTEKGVFGLFTNPSGLIPRFSFNEQRKMVNDLVAAKGLHGDSLLMKEGLEEWRHDRL
jgi:hypothetical protein